MDLKRRDFIIKGSQLFMASTLLPSSVMAADSSPRFQLALSQYSLRALLKAGSLNALNFPAFTANTFGIKAIDLWEGGLAKDKLDDSSYLEKVRKNAEKAGTDLFLLMAGTLQSNPKKVEKSIATLTKSLDRAQRLDCDFLRVFLMADNMADAASAMKKLADQAAKRNIKIIIEPTPRGRGREGAFLAQLHQNLNHSHLTLMPDFGKLKNNIYTGTQAMLPYSESISAKMHSFDAQGKQPDFDYDRLAKMIIDSKYKGYLAIEWEGSALKPVAGVKASQKLIIDSFAKYGAKVL
jgi:hypothetical protein